VRDKLVAELDYSIKDLELCAKVSLILKKQLDVAYRVSTCLFCNPLVFTKQIAKRVRYRTNFATLLFGNRPFSQQNSCKQDKVAVSFV
jgi:hypothetical protein